MNGSSMGSLAIAVDSVRAYGRGSNNDPGRIIMADVLVTPVQPSATPYQARVPTDVRVVGFNMPFFNLVGFFIKAAFAAVPAAIVVAIIWVVLAAIFFGGIAGIAGGLMGRHI
jgi:hypothetical protein